MAMGGQRKEKGVNEERERERERETERERERERERDETPMPGIKNSKFKEAVKKVMLDIRMKQLKQKYAQDLSDALEVWNKPITQRNRKPLRNWY